MRLKTNLDIHTTPSFPRRIRRHFTVKFVCPTAPHAHWLTPSKIVVVHWKSWRASHHHTVVAYRPIQLQYRAMLLVSLQLRPDVSVAVQRYDAVQQQRCGRDVAGQELPGRDFGANYLDGVAKVRIRQWRHQSRPAVHCELEGRCLVGRQVASPCDGLPYVGRKSLERGDYKWLLRIFLVSSVLEPRDRLLAEVKYFFGQSRREEFVDHLGFRQVQSYAGAFCIKTPTVKWRVRDCGDSSAEIGP